MLETDTMGWMFFSHAERRSLIAAGETTLVMVKGPAHLWSSFFMGQSEEWYYDQNHQVAPEYRVGDKAWLSLQNYFMSSTTCSRAAFTSSWVQPSCLARVSAASMVEVLIGSTPRHRCCLVSSSNRVQQVAEWTLLLYANSASGSQSAQLSCRWLMKTQRYAPISWLTHSIWLSVCRW